MRPLFTLDSRLAACAELVRSGSHLADIGTDHAYLPVWLAKNGRISYAIAADINSQPLERGVENIKKYHAEDKVTARLSNGLESINPSEVDDIVIAGMGAELIIDILSKAPWIKHKEKRLILQPMTRAYLLRKYLYDSGFQIISEQACAHNGKIYSVMAAEFYGNNFVYSDYEVYMGKLDTSDEQAKMYGLQTEKMLLNKREGILHSGENPSMLDIVISEIEKRCSDDEC